ncbi:hypothetical protein EST38_g9804 [Candolleomyces aberdarensis]|uniref:cysteine synthase n=1 Tax=Candolleomyces aberdarensis TaxID=2316362 RepID=A0A4Q2DC99_9AGAR|nr:hypothetical protein EST38_g9804 [Candolleomyces aberdarensis]
MSSNSNHNPHGAATTSGGRPLFLAAVAVANNRETRLLRDSDWHIAVTDVLFLGPALPNPDEIVNGVTGLIGNTPLMRINSLSDALGVEILGKAEFLNPGGSVKDRVALRMIEDAERMGFLRPHTGSRIFEGTVGSTGISIATIARARGYETTIIMPDDVAEEKVKALLSLGAEVQRVRPASIVDKKQNKSNFDAHFSGTGPEIWKQANGQVDAFVSGAGTGGTVAGCGQYLKSVKEDIIVAISDPEGSGLYNKVKFGVLFDRKEAEGTKRRHQVDTVVEGIGINRLTHNMELGLPVVDDAFRITDAEAVAMSRFLVKNDGLFLGSSSACNVMACVKLVKKMGWEGSGKCAVTILCDSGTRHYSKFWSEEYLKNAGIPVDLSLVEDLLRKTA